MNYDYLIISFICIVFSLFIIGFLLYLSCFMELKPSFKEYKTIKTSKYSNEEIEDLLDNLIKEHDIQTLNNNEKNKIKEVALDFHKRIINLKTK